MNKFFDSKLFYKLLALIITILLTVYVSYNQVGFIPRGQRTRTLQTVTKTETLKLPLQISVNTDKYYVTGYPEKVKVNITGPSALVVSAINTKNFRAFIDLSELKIGKHQVPIRVSGLSNQLSYKISPKKIVVDIQERKTRTLPIKIRYNSDVLSKEYFVYAPYCKPSMVEVTGEKSEVNHISKIIANVDIRKKTIHSFDSEVMLVAVDASGKQLNVVIQPETTHVYIPIRKYKKRVRLNITSHNAASNRMYSLTSSIKKVTLYGAASTLKDIVQLDVDVNLAGIVHNTSKKVRLKLPKGVVKADPSDIWVKIEMADISAIKN